MDLKIIDSGWLSSARTGTQESGANRVNSGSAITLKTKSVVLGGKALINADPIPASFADAPVNLNGYENDLITIVIIIDKSTSAEYDLLAELSRLWKTKGVKLLYPSILTDSKKSLIELLGSTSTNFNNNEVGASTPTMMGYFQKGTIRDVANSSKFSVTLPFKVTG